MKILIVSTIPTHPTNAGNRKWILSQTILLKDLGHEVHFLYIYERALKKVNNDFISYSKTAGYWGEYFHCYQVPVWEKLRLSLTDYIRKKFYNWYWKCDDAYPYGLHRVINKLNAKIGFNATIINYYYLSKCLKYINIPLKAISTHDCFSFRNLAIKTKGVYTTMPNEEAKAMQRCPHIFALQDEERIFFQKLSPGSSVYSVYGTYGFYDMPITYTHRLLFFSGGNEYNINGLYWFLDKIYPVIMKHFPDIELWIGGGICSNLKELNGKNGIKLLGFYEDPKDFYKLGDIVINPTYQGTGLKIKTFEGIAYGKVVIAHPHSIVGIYNCQNAPVFCSCIAEEWRNYIEQIWVSRKIAQIKDQDKAYIMALNKYVRAQYKNFLS